jgi:hypothetical protein
VLVPFVAPKLVPLIVTTVATGPLAGKRLVMTGGKMTVNGNELLARTPTVTTTSRVVAPANCGDDDATRGPGRRAAAMR